MKSSANRKRNRLLAMPRLFSHKPLSSSNPQEKKEVLKQQVALNLPERNQKLRHSRHQKAPEMTKSMQLSHQFPNSFQLQAKYSLPRTNPWAPIRDQWEAVLGLVLDKSSTFRSTLKSRLCRSSRLSHPLQIPMIPTRRAGKDKLHEPARICLKVLSLRRSLGHHQPWHQQQRELLQKSSSRPSKTPTRPRRSLRLREDRLWLRSQQLNHLQKSRNPRRG